MTEKRNRKQGFPPLSPGRDGTSEISREKTIEAGRLLLTPATTFCPFEPQLMRGMEGSS
jgi:hypothetical protein